MKRLVENNSVGFIKPEYLKPQLSTKLYKNTLEYLRQFHREGIFDEACIELGMPKTFLLSEDNWVSLEFGSQFAEKIRLKTADPDIYRKIGHNFLSPNTMNAIDYVFLRSLSPFILLNLMKKNYKRTNAICDLQIEKLGVGKFRFAISSPIPMYSDLLLNSIGVLESFENLFTLRNFRCEQEVDPNQNPKSFSVVVEYSAYRFMVDRVQRASWYIGAGLALGFILRFMENHMSISFIPILTMILLLGGMAAKKLIESMRILQRNDETIQRKSLEKNQVLFEKAELLERRYSEANLLKKLSQELVACLEPNQVIEKTLLACQKNFKFNKAAVFLYSRQRQRLYLSSSVGFESASKNLSNIEFVFPNPDAKDGFIASVLTSGKTALILDVETYGENLKPENRQLLNQLNVGSLILTPLQSGKNKFGVLIIVRDVGEVVLNSSDRFLAESIASLFSLNIESALNYENESKLRHIFQKYVPRPVIESILDSGYLSSGILAPQKKEIVSFFADLRGFTAASDNLSPEKVFELINSYSSFLTQRLVKHGAIIDNIIGDEIVCFFIKKNADDTSFLTESFEALKCIFSEIQDFENDLLRRGFPHLKFGMGLHYGEASLGSVGTENKMNFTALGTTVNIASRLQQLCKKFDEGFAVAIASREYLEALGIPSHSPYQKELLRGLSNWTEFAVIQPDSDLIKIKPLRKAS